ncbi:hypothetical protein [Luteococcus peritonei]|uniref:LytR family transcriptional regulator n=1 Tax=Luteococcus peritonei TaxID=88874 RepID=A0ABW4RXW9_9ACTN
MSHTPHWSDSSTGPDELEVAPALRSSRFPKWLLVLMGVLLGALVVGGAGLTAWRINAAKPQVVITAGPSKTPFALVPPLAVGEYSRDASANDQPSVNPTTKKSAIAATYARGGQNSVVLLMSRPEADVKKFMTDMGMNTVIQTEDGYCGTSVDTNRDGCAIVRGNTAIMLVDLVGLTRTDLMELTHDFADELDR